MLSQPGLTGEQQRGACCVCQARGQRLAEPRWDPRREQNFPGAWLAHAAPGGASPRLARLTWHSGKGGLRTPRIALLSMAGVVQPRRVCPWDSWARASVGTESALAPGAGATGSRPRRLLLGTRWERLGAANPEPTCAA